MSTSRAPCCAAGRCGSLPLQLLRRCCHSDLPARTSPLPPCRSGVCLMTDNSVNVCRYSYAAAAIGIVASLVMVFAMARFYLSLFVSMHAGCASAPAAPCHALPVCRACILMAVTLSKRKAGVVGERARCAHSAAVHAWRADHAGCAVCLHLVRGAGACTCPRCH